ncbi:MAG TPA: hypothetical protein VK009_09325 [Chloroflexota bacterium]|nr:hypothetical protein [Chloroflexota bacterium]
MTAVTAPLDTAALADAEAGDAAGGWLDGLAAAELDVAGADVPPQATRDAAKPNAAQTVKAFEFQVTIGWQRITVSSWWSGRLAA